MYHNCHVVSYETLDILFFLLSAQLTVQWETSKTKLKENSRKIIAQKSYYELYFVPVKDRPVLIGPRRWSFPCPWTTFPFWVLVNGWAIGCAHMWCWWCWWWCWWGWWMWWMWLVVGGRGDLLIRSIIAQGGDWELWLHNGGPQVCVERRENLGENVSGRFPATVHRLGSQVTSLF